MTTRLTFDFLFFFVPLTVHPPTAMPDLAAIDSAVSTLEYQMEKIKERVRDDMEAIPKAKVLLSFSLFFVSVFDIECIDFFYVSECFDLCLVLSY